MRTRSLLMLSVAACVALPAATYAGDKTLPQNGTVASGSVVITQPGAGNMVIDQGSAQAIVNWGSFSVGKDARVDIQQPNAQSSILNRVTGGTRSDIHGQINANGNVHLVNPNGIYIGPNGTVNAGGFSASTLNISDEDFRAGKLQYKGNGNSGTVDNAGRITIGRGGYAALIGGKVRNSGTVLVPFGRIGLAAGEWVTLDVSGDQFLQVAVPSDSEDNDVLIDNSGTVRAEGGLIEMRAATARHAARHAINLSGVAEASSVSVRGGAIVLGGGAGGKVTVSGRTSAMSRPRRTNIVVDASPRPTRRGGSVEITGNQIELRGAQIDASGPSGGGLIRVGGDFGGLGDLQRAATLFADAETMIVSDATASGDGGRIALWSDIQTDFAGDIRARAGAEGGNGGFVEVSSKKTLNYSGFTDTRAPQGVWGTLLLDPDDIFVGPSDGGEDTLEANLAAGNVTLDTASENTDPGDITIAADIDWTAATSLTLIADNDILINGSISGPNGDLTLDANGDATVNFGHSFDVQTMTVDATNFTFDADITAGDIAINAVTAVLAGSIASGELDIEADTVQLDGSVDAGIGLLVGNSVTINGFALFNDLNIDGANTQINGSAEASALVISSSAIGVVGDVTVDDVSVSADTFTLDGFMTVNGSGGSGVDVDLFQVNAGNWEQVNASLSPFAATNFQLDFGSDFLRAQGGTGAVGDPFLITDVFGLQGMDFEGGGQFELANDIDASGTELWTGPNGLGFRPLINSDGSLDGGGFAIADLSTAPDGEGSPVDAAFFDFIGAAGSVRDLQLTGADVTGRDAAVLAVSNAGTIENVQVSGTVTAEGDEVGGFVAFNSGTINDSSANVAVNVDNTARFGVGADLFAGGFVGLNEGTINRSHAAGNVSYENAFDATINAGGFAGQEGAAMTINDSYALGDVTVNDAFASGAGINAGGFIGQILGSVNRSYSLGSVSVATAGTPSVGGFAGQSFGAAVAGNFWNTETSGLATGDGATGLTTSQFQNTAEFIALAGPQGWDFNTVWAPGDAGFNPVNYSTSPVIFATPNDLNVQYGQTATATATGSVAGGPLLFVFDEDGDILDTDTVFTSLSFSDRNVGSRTFTLNTLSLNSSGGVAYRVIDLQGNAQITPAPLTITANDAEKLTGTSLVFDGTEFTVAGLFFEDGVSSVTLLSDGTPAAAPVGDYAIAGSDAEGSGLSNYDISFVDGTLAVADSFPEEEGEPTGGEGDSVPRPPPFIGITLPNPTDTIDTGSERSASLAGGAVAGAEETLADVEDISQALEIAADNCGESSGDVTRYLACMSDSLDEFADELDDLSAELPPGMQNVARIVRDARVKVDQARSRAQGRLTTATSDAERETIRRDAITEAATALADAATEIRKSIALVRADDPELASVQRATVTTVADAVDNVGIKLSRSVGL